jgi:hypothetical protein
MRELRYPNESREYRDARESLLRDEQELDAALLVHVRAELG